MSSSMMHTHTRQSATHPMVATDVVILASVVGFILTFFHWYGVSSAAGSITLNGWHGWGIPAAILFAVGALFSLGRAFGLTAGRAIGDSVLLTVIGVAAIVCTIIFMVTEGSGYGAGYDKGPLYGAVVGLICAIVMTGSALLVGQESDT
jgi:cation transport ATPase